MSDHHDVTDEPSTSELHRAHDAEVAVEAHKEHHHVNYLMVFLVLIGFTIISYLADVLGGRMGAEPGSKVKVFVGLIVLVVASFKAAAVMLYFMHLKFERHWKYALLAPTIILALAMIVSLMPDIAGDYYSRVIPQTEAAAEAHQGAVAHAPAHTPEKKEAEAPKESAPESKSPPTTEKPEKH